MTKSNFKSGDSVTWIKKMSIVPHPEGNTDRDGNILPVFRNTKISGRIISSSSDKTFWVRPNSINKHNIKICGERYYDVRVHEAALSHA
jgi:hypothetical protein